ncbi:hypothetical protein MSG28_012919, partial [Choristoneura fumiferana]
MQHEQNPLVGEESSAAEGDGDRGRYRYQCWQRSGLAVLPSKLLWPSANRAQL